VSTTGGVVIRSGIGDSNPYSFTEFKNCWFEGNKAVSLKAEATLSTTLRLNGCHFYDAANNGGNEVEIAGISVLEVNHCHFYGTGAALTTAADNTIINGKLGLAGIVYTDNSTNGPNTTNITRNVTTSHVDSKSVTANGAQYNQGQVGPVAYLSVQDLGANGGDVPTVGAYDLDTSTLQGLNLQCAAVRIPYYSTAQIADIDHPCNSASAKAWGSMVYNYTLKMPMWSELTGASARWHTASVVDLANPIAANGEYVITPA
jgi:hypothetical protein